MHEYKRQIVVIGGGCGGLYAASTLSRLGYTVTLIDQNENVGGEYLNLGVIPRTVFIEAAKIAHDARQATKLGISCNVNIDFRALQEHVKEKMLYMQKYYNRMRLKSYGVKVVKGTGHFVGEHMISVEDKLIPAEKFIIATGSTAKIPHIPGLAEITYYTTETILNIAKQPRTLIIIGSDLVGLEYAQAFCRLGTKVTVIEEDSNIATTCTQSQIHTLKEILITEGVEFFINANILTVTGSKDDQNNQLGEVCLEISAESGVVNMTVDALLLAKGRKPQLDNLGLELLDIAYNEQGILVDEYLRTSKSHIYALGDVIISPYKFSYISEYQASVVIDHLAFKRKKKIAYSTIPKIMATDPEYAQVGLTEHTAKEKNIRYKIIDYPLTKLDKAMLSGEAEGSIKLFVKNNKLLGASILSPNAGEIIHTLALAIHNNIHLRNISDITYAYPTWSQMFRKAINKYYEAKLFSKLSRFYIRIRHYFE